MALRFVAFDLGNVLCDLDVRAFAEALADACQVQFSVVESAFDSAAHTAMERGASVPEVFRSGLLARVGRTLSNAEFDRCWNLIPTPRTPNRLKP